jgi:short-subunit dehydrogenase
VSVSVLCPGFVRTNLVKGQRDKWQDRLGPQPGVTTNPMGALIEQVVDDGVRDGIDPDDVANEVHDAVIADRFWILTHPDMRHSPVERMERAERQENPE